MEYRGRARDDEAGRKADPREATSTPPRPMPSGPAQLRNLSLGAHAATVLRPPTMPVGGGRLEDFDGQ